MYKINKGLIYAKAENIYIHIYEMNYNSKYGGGVKKYIYILYIIEEIADTYIYIYIYIYIYTLLRMNNRYKIEYPY